MALRFTIASFNIHECVGRDRRRDVDRIAEVIRELDADVVGLQEVDSRFGVEKEAAQMQYLAQAVGFSAIAGPAIERPQRHFGNVILTKHPILRVRHLDLSVARYEPRGAIDADLNIYGREVRVIVTHFGLRGKERRRQAERLLATIEQHSPEQPLVVMGDFNEWLPRSRSLKWMQTRLGISPAPRTYPAYFPLLPLDRIWVSPARALVNLCAHHSSITRVCSDHLPVKAIVVVD